MPVVTSGNSSITFSQGKSFRSLAQQKKIFVDFEAEFNKDVTSAQIGFSGYTTGDGDLDDLYNPLSLTKFSFDFSGRKVFDPNKQFVFSYSPDISIRLQATINPTGYDYYLDGIGIASNMAKDDFVISDFYVDITGNSNARLKIKNFIIDGDIKHAFSTTSPALISYDKPDIPIAISGSSVKKYDKASNAFLDTVEPYYSSIFKTKTNGVRWSTPTGVGFKSDSIENYSSLLSGLHGTGIQYSGVIYNDEIASDEVLEEDFNIILNSNHGAYSIPTSTVDSNEVFFVEGNDESLHFIADYNVSSEAASLKENKISSDLYKAYIPKGDDSSSPPSPINAPDQNDTRTLPATQKIHLSNTEGYLLSFEVEQVSADKGGIATEIHIDEIATNEYNVVYGLIPMDPDRQVSDPYKNYKFPLSYAFISGDGNEGQYKPLKGVTFGNSSNIYTSPIDNTEYTLSRSGDFSFYEGNAGEAFPITRGKEGDALYGEQIIFTGAAGATGIGILGATTPAVYDTYGSSVIQNVGPDEIANILITDAGGNIDVFSPLMVGDLQGDDNAKNLYKEVHPKVTGAAVLYNTTGYTKSVYDWALFSGDINEKGTSQLWINTDAKKEHPKEVDGTKASYLNSFTNAYLTNGEPLNFRLKNKFYADTDESKIKLVFSGIPTGDNIVVKALNKEGAEENVFLGAVRISEGSQLKDHTVYAMDDETKVIEVEVTGGASIGADGQFILQDHTRIKENISLQVSGDSLDYFTKYPNYYNASVIGNTIPWDPAYVDPDLIPRRVDPREEVQIT
jgi:hypothetical protein